MKKLKKFKRHVAKLMVAVMISTLLSSVFSSVAYANEITELTSETSEGSEENGITEEGQDENVQNDEMNSNETNEENSETENDSVAEDDSEKEDISEEKSGNEEDSEQESDSQTEDKSEQNSEQETSEKASEETSETNSETGKKEENKKGTVKGTRSLNGWVEDGDTAHFYRDGAMVTEEIVEYNNNLYYFDWNGNLMKDDYDYVYLDGTGYYGYIRAKEDGTLYRNEWYISYYDERTYMGDDGIAFSEGIHNIDGTDYYFVDSWLCTSYNTVTVKGKLYFINKDGEIIEAEDNDWFECDGYKFYIQNGSLIKGDKVIEIENYLYGFDWEGKMYDNVIFYIDSYDEEKEEWNYNIHYYAKSGGKLARNEWYEADGELISYYGNDGKAYADGIYTIDGEKYYFYSNGEVASSGVQKIDGQPYVIKNYKLYLLNYNGWTTVDENKFYTIEGEPVRQKVIRIDGALYGFDWYGNMIDGYTFRFYIYDDDGNCIGENYYTARSGGQLYENEWRIIDDYEAYYYGENGVQYRDGLYQIENNLYYFNSWGELQKNRSIEIDGVQYIIDENGIAQSMENYSGLYEAGGYTYYYENGIAVINQVKEIDGSLHVFDEYGHMAFDRTVGISIYDDDGDWIATDWYYADGNGCIWTNSWRYSRYYGPDGKAYKDGVYLINGTYYYFDESGYTGYGEAVVCKGKAYLVDWNGRATEVSGDGWHELDGRKYYLKNGQFYKRCTATIDGNMYYFGYDAVMLKNSVTYVRLDDFEGYIAAKNGGALYVNEWKKDTNTWYYFGSDGLAVKGLNTIGGKQYYFSDDCELFRNGGITIKGKQYIADNSGELKEVLGDGWQELDGYRYYVENGDFVKRCVKQIGNNWYAFDKDGKQVIDGKLQYDYYDSEQGRYYNYIYFTDADGIVLRNRWLEYDSGEVITYYLGADGRAYSNGIYEVDGTRYYFSYGGGRQWNRLFSIDGQWYLADKSGSVHDAQNNDWVQTSVGMYYIYQYSIVRNMVLAIDGVQYGFDEFGILLKNGLIDWRKKTYITDENGVATIAPDGWMIKGDDVYYIRDGQMLRNAIINFDGEAYAFGSDGKWIKNRGFDISRFSATTNDFDPYKHDSSTSGNSTDPYENYSVNLSTYQKINSGNSELPYSVSSNAYNPYMADKDGKVLRNTWFHDEIDDFWCYFDETCRKVAGWKVLDGKTYYMNKLGVRQSGWQTIKGKKYNFKENGVLRTNCLVTGEDGNKYYVNKNGEIQKNKLVTVGDKKYYVDKNGIVKTSSLVTVGDKKYYVDAKGVVKTDSLVTVGNKKYYVDSKGVVKTDSLVTVGNKKYYVDSKGVVKTNSLVTVGNKQYYVDSKGVVKTDGWVTVSKKKYYVDKKGVVKTNCFVTVDGKKYHVNAKGVMQTGWQKIDKKWYYFDPKTGVMVTGTKKIDGKTYKFNSKGVCTNK